MNAHEKPDAARGDALNELEAKRLLAQYGIQTPKGLRFERAEDVTATALAGLRRPLACKILNRQGAHKSDFGGVRLHLSTIEDVRNAIALIEAGARDAGVSPDGFLVEEQVEPGVELVIGGLSDPRFGPCVMVGLGGVFVEIFEDVAFRVCPISQSDARAMIGELRAAPILRGARGGRVFDEAKLVDALMGLGGPDGLLCALDGEIAEVDVNPLILNNNGAFAADARILPAKAGAAKAARPAPLDHAAVAAAYRPLFKPRSVAVLGASATGSSFGNEVIRHSRKFGFGGEMIPIHPKAAEVEGLKAVASLQGLAEPVDFAYVAIGAEAAVDALEKAPGKARFVQVMSSGFGETPEGKHNEERLLAAARAGGMRLIGPNCLGVHSPGGGITFVGDSLNEPGSVGIVSQSGGLAVDIILRGQEKGLRFSGVTTLGNSVDLTPADLLEYHLSDPDTEIIGLYLEDVRDGRRFVGRLVEAKARKPVVLLVGGRTEAGRRAAASHTGSLAADTRLWDGVARQTGAIVVDTLDQFLNALLMFQMTREPRPHPTRKVALFGNGGGTSVLAADALARLGLEVPVVSTTMRQKLDALALPPGTGLDNPIDTPAGTLRHRNGAVVGEIIDILVDGNDYDAIILHVNLTVFTSSSNQEVDVIGNIVREAVRVRTSNPDAPRLILTLRSDGGEVTETRKRADRHAALASGIAVYDELIDAAEALSSLTRWERFRAGEA